MRVNGLGVCCGLVEAGGEGGWHEVEFLEVLLLDGGGCDAFQFFGGEAEDGDRAVGGTGIECEAVEGPGMLLACRHDRKSSTYQLRSRI